MVEADTRILLDWDALEVGETFDTYEYLLTQEMIDAYRKGVMDPEASFPTISHKVDVRQYNAKYRDAGSVNARCAFYCYNPPVGGKRITVLRNVRSSTRRSRASILRFRRPGPEIGWETCRTR